MDHIICIKVVYVNVYPNPATATQGLGHGSWCSTMVLLVSQSKVTKSTQHNLNSTYCCDQTGIKRGKQKQKHAWVLLPFFLPTQTLTSSLRFAWTSSGNMTCRLLQTDYTESAIITQNRLTIYFTLNSSLHQVFRSRQSW
jgi:hypothetical protein